MKKNRKRDNIIKKFDTDSQRDTEYFVTNQGIGEKDDPYLTLSDKV